MVTADLSLFKQLNEEYASKKVVPSPRSHSSSRLLSEAERRAMMLDKKLGVRGTRVLEVGCGRGQLGQVLAEQYGCDYVGVDIVEYESWAQLGDQIDLRIHDITLLKNEELGHFDRIVSFAVFEHVERPYEGVEALGSLLAPGGLAYISANLYRGPKASHRYREVFFPFPHLLFDDEVFAQYYAGLGREGKPAWVNKLTAAQYREKMREAGLYIVDEWADRTALDQDFFERFRDALGKYPLDDLEMDFIHLIVTPVEARSEFLSGLRSDDRLLEAEATMDVLRGELRQAEARLAQVEASTSWKLTAPLRWFGDAQPAIRSLAKGLSNR